MAPLADPSGHIEKIPPGISATGYSRTAGAVVAAVPGTVIVVIGPEQHHHPEWHGIKDMDTAPVLVAAASGPWEILILIPLGRVKWIRGRISETSRLILCRATRSLAFGHYGRICFGLNFLGELDVALYYN